MLLGVPDRFVETALQRSGLGRGRNIRPGPALRIELPGIVEATLEREPMRDEQVALAVEHR
jgi:hypothetical protein